jgi:hypothetical protein
VYNSAVEVVLGDRDDPSTGCTLRPTTASGLSLRSYRGPS